MPGKRSKDGSIVTSVGRRFWPLDPRPEDVCIYDIAHHLSNICRFTGAVRKLYSVAQHSVHVSQLCQQHPLIALLHDASEAYLADVASPVKQSHEMAAYREAEIRLTRCIFTRFNIPVQVRAPVNGSSALIPYDVKLIDETMRIYEGQAFMPKRKDAFWSTSLMCPFKLTAWSPARAEAVFLRRFNELYKG